jgi:hypothetical protein
VNQLPLPVDTMRVGPRSGLRYDDADQCERRTQASASNPGGRDDNELSPSKLFHPNGTRLCAQPPALVNAMLAECHRLRRLARRSLTEEQAS